MQEISIHPSTLGQLKYILFPGNILSDDPSLMNLHNLSFNYWKEFWQNVFKQNLSHSRVNPDAFFRQNIIALLLHKESEVVALHMYTFFNLNSSASLSNSYILNNYTDSFIENIRSKSQIAMSLEYLTVNPNWTRKKIGISIAETMISLGINCMNFYNADVAVGIARSDIRVNKMCHKLGFDSLERDIVRHNTTCDLIALHKENIKKHPNINVAQLSNNLWSKKINRLYTPLLEDKIKAA